MKECLHDTKQTSSSTQAVEKKTHKKSLGPDGITNIMSKHLGNSAICKLLEIYNPSWSSCTLLQRYGGRQLWYPYLEVTFNKRHTSKPHIAHVKGKARQNLTILIDEQVLKTSYQGTVRPNLLISIGHNSQRQPSELGSRLKSRCYALSQEPWRNTKILLRAH